MRALSRLILALPLTAAPAAAQPTPHPALVELIPLVEVYDARRNQAPGFDVAGIRCAALVQAQDSVARRFTNLPGPDARALRAARANLSAAEVDRQQRGQSRTRATASTRADGQRVQALYVTRFEQNLARGVHPWRGDSLIERDTIYCGFLNERG
jgi:hypothetical protein